MKHDEQSIFLLRRIPEVINYIRSTYRWLDARMFKDFDEFIDRVIFSSVRDFVSVEVTNVSYEDYERLRNKFYPIIKEIVESELMDEIKKHYNKERGIRENIIRIKQLMGVINESSRVQFLVKFIDETFDRLDMVKNEDVMINHFHWYDGGEHVFEKNSWGKLFIYDCDIYRNLRKKADYLLSIGSEEFIELWKNYLNQKYQEEFQDRPIRVIGHEDCDKWENDFAELGENTEELTEKCWKGYTQKGMKTMFGKRYPNCVKKKN